ncbi:unnamed protein product [Nezara viridula]|uniref:Nucleoporin Nup133/Nup155-like N-terminal domain-containing protein n=1 Tax=Nezara viridula TaxID=85310 RepID=A0A9P0H3T0_NEZVI|nr:unnamed protein product [Nezara viridula]
MTSSSTQTMPVAQRAIHSRVRPGVSKNVLYSTYHHVVELYGSQMPVLVAESLNYTPGAKDNASVNLNPDIAWAWYVFGRRLLVWHIPSFTDTTLPVMARDMLLPSSDLAHNANLVYIFSGPNQKSPSCIAVSPEGIVRYWVVLGHHTTWIDVDAHLGGEEVCAVHYVPPLGCLAVTTSGSMILITPKFGNDSPSVEVKRITPAYGWLNSIGKTVSSLLFGSQPQRLETQSVKVLTCQKVETYWHIFLLAGFTLQSWTVEIINLVSALIYETNIEHMIRQVFPYQIRDNPENEIQITDIRPSEADCIICLAASDDPRYYVIVELDGNDINPPTSALRLCVIAKNNINFLENISGDLSSLRFVLLPTTALVFSKHIIYAVPLSGGEEMEGEPLDLPGGIVLGGIMHKRTPIFFSATFGFVSITPVNTSSIDVLNTSVVETSAIPPTVSDREPVTSTTMNDINFLKIAFVYYVRKNYKQCLNVINEEFLSSKNTHIDSVLSTTLVKVSLDIINDLSPKDNRWENIAKDPIGGISSLHLDTQLAEKLKAHDLFLKFARRLAVVINLGKVTKLNDTVKTIHVLYEHNEKIATAFMLRKLQKKFGKTVQDAVADVARDLNFEYTREIGLLDHFYRYASVSDEALRRLINICLENVGDYTTTFGYLRLLKETNAVINSILGSIIRRKCKKGYYIDTTYLPWLSASPGLFSDIIALANLNINVIKSWGAQALKLRSILRQFFKLCNNLLFLRMPYITKVEFDKLSSSFIQFFMDKNMLFEALRLAYKYKNFDYLAPLIYHLHLEADIADYIKEFGREGFCDCLFEYLYSAGKYKHLLNLSLPEVYELQLKEYISDKPVLKWVYCLKQNDLVTANETLLNLVSNEEIRNHDQEIICIFSILLSRAGWSDENPFVTALLKRINLQHLIPDKIFLQQGYDPELIQALSYEEILEVYVAGNSENENKELFFMRALKAIDSIEDPDSKELIRMKIWANAVGLDSWEGYDSEYPVEMTDAFLTFRLMKLLRSSEDDVQTFKVPTIDDLLLCEELKEDKRVKVFRDNPQCKYIYQYWYERIIDDENLLVPIKKVTDPEHFNVEYESDNENSDES